jgi:hypothetical protein
MTAESFLHLCYIFTAIFGVGVTVVDLLGLLGGGGHGDHSHDSDHSSADNSVDCQPGEHLAHHSDQGGHSNIPLLSILRYLRMIVYFSLGFGPLGLMAEATGAGLIGSLVWALSGGILVALIGRAFFRFQQRDIDSSVRVEDLFLGNARVIVPIRDGNMGKVRVYIGQSVAERYALAEDAGDSFPTDAEVQIVRVTDDCVYVRRLDEHLATVKRPLPNKISM